MTSHQPPAASSQPERAESRRSRAGSWQLEAGSWKLEAGSWKLGAGSWKLAAASRTAAVLIAAVTLASAAFAQMPPLSGGQMPDPKQMSGTPLPAGDVPAGTVTIRVVRGQMTNVLKGQSVTLTGAGAAKSQQTDDSGHATFSGLTPGTRVQASVTVDGEKIDSQSFEVPQAGGVRMVLVATDPDAAKKAAEAQALAQSAPVQGTVVLGSDSRFVIEVGDEGLNVFNILTVVNTARRPVQTDAPLVFTLPEGARGASMIEGSTPNAAVVKKTVVVNGPFPPGPTTVQFAYSLPMDAGTITIQEKLPVQMTQFTLLAQKIGAMTVSSPQMSEHRDMEADGQSYIVGQGPAIAPGTTVTLTLSGVPHPPSWPKNLALTLSVALLAWGAWAALRVRETDEQKARRAKLQAKREKLFGELAAVEQQHRAGAIDPQRYDSRRRELLAALEAVYEQLDEQVAA